MNFENLVPRIKRLFKENGLYKYLRQPSFDTELKNMFAPVLSYDSRNFMHFQNGLFLNFDNGIFEAMYADNDNELFDLIAEEFLKFLTSEKVIQEFMKNIQVKCNDLNVKAPKSVKEYLNSCKEFDPRMIIVNAFYWRTNDGIAWSQVSMNWKIWLKNCFRKSFVEDGNS